MDSKFVFSGNCTFVLKRMLQRGLKVDKIWTVGESFLQKYFNSKIYDYEDLSIIMKYEQYMNVKKGDCLIRFELFAD